MTEAKIVALLRNQSCKWERIRELLGDAASPIIRSLCFEQRRVIGYSLSYGWGGGFYYLID
jgi:hypothetical protein